MVPQASEKVQPTLLSDRTGLPDSDGTGEKYLPEHQSLMLTDSLAPILQQLHPDGRYAIGGLDCDIYYLKNAEPPESGVETPDWFYVPTIFSEFDGEMRSSYVLWKECIAPVVVLEFASGDGKSERDNTPRLQREDGTASKPGKFWVYEQMMRIPYYGIYYVLDGTLEFYCLYAEAYKREVPNERGHYFIPPLGVELGVWHGVYLNQNQSWMRWWDTQGNLLPISDERA